jgi:hypothetical protein
LDFQKNQLLLHHEVNSENMSTTDEIKAFLQDFKTKPGIWGVVFRDDRGKNARALLELDITPAYRERVLRELQVTDYHEGPKRETLYGGAEHPMKSSKNRL